MILQVRRAVDSLPPGVRSTAINDPAWRIMRGTDRPRPCSRHPRTSWSAPTCSWVSSTRGSSRPSGCNSLDRRRRFGQRGVMPRLNSGKVSLHYLDVGLGDVILWLHAFPLNAEMWVAQIDGLPDLRHVAPDHRGFGGSIPAAETLTMDMIADDAATVLDRSGSSGRSSPVSRWGATPRSRSGGGTGRGCVVSCSRHARHSRHGRARSARREFARSPRARGCGGWRTRWRLGSSGAPRTRRSISWCGT